MPASDIETHKEPPLGTNATLMCAWNLQVFAIFRDAAAGDRDALLFQHLGNLFVGQGISRIFLLDKLLHFTLYDEQRRSVSQRAIHRFREEEPQLKYALRGVSELIGDRAAYGRWMHTNLFGHILDHHRFQMIDAFVQE